MKQLQSELEKTQKNQNPNQNTFHSSLSLWGFEGVLHDLKLIQTQIKKKIQGCNDYLHLI